MIDTAIIVAGGFGTRLKPLMDSIPKPMVLVRGKPALHHIIDNLKAHQVKNIIICVGYKADVIQNYFKDGSSFEVNITYSKEEQPLGTGGAVNLASKGLIQPFFLLWGDGLMKIDWTEMYKLFLTENAEMIMALSQREDVENFGSTILEGNRIIHFVDKPSPKEISSISSKIVDIGAYVINPQCLSLPEGKSSIERDFFEKIVKKGKVHGYFHPGTWFPLDTMEKYQIACQEFIPS